MLQSLPNPYQTLYHFQNVEYDIPNFFAHLAYITGSTYAYSGISKTTLSHCSFVIQWRSQERSIPSVRLQNPYIHFRSFAKYRQRSQNSCGKSASHSELSLQQTSLYSHLHLLSSVTVSLKRLSLRSSCRPIAILLMSFPRSVQGIARFAIPLFTTGRGIHCAKSKNLSALTLVYKTCVYIYFLPFFIVPVLKAVRSINLLLYRLRTW